VIILEAQRTQKAVTIKYKEWMIRLDAIRIPGTSFKAWNT
jgi:hypothetical protein